MIVVRAKGEGKVKCSSPVSGSGMMVENTRTGPGGGGGVESWGINK